MKETTASAKPLARPIGWRSVPALTAELQSRGPLLGPPPGDVRRSAWHVPPRRPQCGPYPVDTLGRPIGAGVRPAASRDHFHSPYFVTQFSLASVSCSYTTAMPFSRATYCARRLEGV